MTGTGLLAAVSAAVTVAVVVAWVLGVLPDRLGRDRRATGRTSGHVVMQLWLLHAGVRTTPLRFVLTSLAFGLVTGLLVGALTGTSLLGIVAGAGVGLLPTVWFRRQRAQRATAVVAAWPDALRGLVAALEAGSSLHQALMQLARSGPVALRGPFRRYAAVAPAASPALALQALRDELGDPVTDRVVEVLMLAMVQGPAIVIGVLRDLAAATSSDLALNERIRTAQLEQQLNGWAVLVIPYALLALLCARVAAFAQFYQRPMGYLVVALGLSLSVAGMLVLSRLARLTAEPRVFAGHGHGSGSSAP